MSDFVYQGGTYTKVREKLHELLLTVGYTEETAHLWLGGDCTEDMFKARGVELTHNRWINRGLCTQEDLNQGIPCTIRLTTNLAEEADYVGMYFGTLENGEMRDTRYGGLPSAIVHRGRPNETLNIWWIVDDESHNFYGPAILRWTLDQTWKLHEVEYVINEKNYTRDQFVQMYEMTHLEEYTGL